MMQVRLPKFMSGYDVVLVVCKIMNETDKLRFLVTSVGEMDGSPIKTVVEYPFVVMIVLACSSCDGGAREVHHSGVNGGLESGVHRVF
jgi:hypothetical protein